MKLQTLTERIGANILYQGHCSTNEIVRFYAGDKMSDLLNYASDSTLIVTNLVNRQLLRFADLMDVPGICLLNDVELSEEMLTTIHEHACTVIVSPHDMQETCQRVRQCL